MSLRCKLGNQIRKASTRSTKSAPIIIGSEPCDNDEICLIPNEPTNKFDVKELIANKGWKNLDLQNIISLQSSDYLTHVEYTEICIAWIEHYRPDQTTVSIIWQTIPFVALSDRYIWDLKNHLTDNLKYHVHAKTSGNRQIISYCFPCNPTELKNKRGSWYEWNGCGMKNCTYIRNHAVKLQFSSKEGAVPLYTRDKKVEYPPCNKVSVRHFHPGTVLHWWGWTDTWNYRRLPLTSDTTEFDSLDDEYCHRTFVSMFTNTSDEFFDRINRGGWKYIACMIQLT